MNDSSTCACGCGATTRTGRRYINGHQNRPLPETLPEEPNPSGLCMCGCGNVTPIASQTIRRRGWVKGKHLKYLLGHQQRRYPQTWTVDESTGCWNWDGATTAGRGGGYPYGTTYGSQLAHRWSYEKHVGPIPAGMVLDHLCRNPRCVNPAHLEPVSATENIRRGAQVKLTESDVHEIRYRRMQGESCKALAAEYEVHPSHISRVARALLWADI